ncbi:uncharacterized protein SPSK_02080 [Sporothrix schenckii 1099-18]|uniref:Uncharacterized protein n=1 Tax=Sporothrix schenckii 1099-18 TaxID=1397361 RepID=A0A0F2MD67_SPOSC|nr:uncharacterized protein SPSK_02080 [Sporothrix schenckii 1099-18]KJR87009.1 hypothetical protein SPSK_02080 [Sporothrix schenckii 1099-18]
MAEWLRQRVAAQRVETETTLKWIRGKQNTLEATMFLAKQTAVAVVRLFRTRWAPSLRDNEHLLLWAQYGYDCRPTGLECGSLAASETVGPAP